MASSMSVTHLSSTASTGRRSNQPQGWEIFGTRLEQLRSDDDLSFDVNEQLPNALKNKYKGREVEGCLLHYAIDADAEAADGDGAEATYAVLEAGARVDSWMRSIAFGQEACAAPIHLAATRGLISVIVLLVERAADVNQKSLHGGQPHFCPIHDAAFLGNLKAVDCLLGLQADPNIANKDGKFPIHIVAEVGSADVSKALITSRARLDLSLPGEEMATPLMIAVRRRMFPNDRLVLLAPFAEPEYDTNFFQTMLQICRENVPAAIAVAGSIRRGELADKELKNRIVESVRHAIRRGFSAIPDLTAIIKLAPEVAAEILDIFLVTPKVSIHHPLPRVAHMAKHYVFGVVRDPTELFARYTPDQEWSFDPTNSDKGKQYPRWHDELAPHPRSDEDDQEVQVRFLSFPNILDIRVYHALNRTRDRRIFGCLTIQALLTCTWQCMRPAAIIQLFQETLVIGILGWWSAVTLPAVPMSPMLPFPLNFVCGDQSADSAATAHPDLVSMAAHRAAIIAMSVLWGVALREVLCGFWQLVMHNSWGFSRRSLLTAGFPWDALATGALATFLVVYSIGGYNNSVVLLFSMNILIRALRLLLRICLIRTVGQQILPIMSSFLPMGRFFLFAFLIYFTFVIAFASLRGDVSIHEVMADLFFAMWVGDGDSFVGLRNLDHRNDLSLLLLLAAVILFTVCTLNLMIAIFSRVYKDNAALGPLLFMSHQCSACEALLLQPRWAEEAPTKRAGEESFLPGARGPYLMSLILFVVWLMLAIVVPPGPFVAWVALLLSGATILLQAAITQSAWFDRDFYKRDEGKEDFEGSSDAEIDLLADAGQSEEMRDGFFIWICCRAELIAHNAFGNAKEDKRDRLLLKLLQRVDELEAAITTRTLPKHGESFRKSGIRVSRVSRRPPATMGAHHG